MKKIGIKCARCGKNLFFMLPECTRDGIAKIEIKCPKSRCGAINIVDYQNPDKIIVRLKE